MSKLQNKLFAKLNRIEEIGPKILLDVRVCEEHLASLVSHSLAQVEQLGQMMMNNSNDHGETFLEVAATLDSIVNVFVLSINSVGASFLYDEQKENENVSNQKSCFEICGLKNLSFEDEEAETPKDDLLLVEAKKKLKEVFKFEEILLAFCRLTSGVTQTRLDASCVCLKVTKDFTRLNKVSLELSKSDLILTELSVMVLQTIEKLELLKLRIGIEEREKVEGETTGTKKDSKDKKIASIESDADGENEGSKDENDVREVDESEKKVGVEEKVDQSPVEMVRDITPSAEEVSGQTEDDWNSTNNYNVVDDDVGVAIEGYKSRQATCAFYSNKGSCYKGELCEFRHVQPRPGAVTADLESLTVRTGEQSAVVVGPSSVLVKIINITSPASFYVTFPHGMRNILTVREDSRRQDSVSAEYRELFESLQEEASKKVRKTWVGNHLAPGTLVVARAADGNWHRAMVRGDSDLHNTLEIFLLDRGVTKTLDEGNLRLLDPQHSLLPFQAEEAELSQLEAPDREGGWRPEAAQTLLEIIETADYLSAVVESVAGLPSGKIVLKVSAVKGEDTEDVGE